MKSQKLKLALLLLALASLGKAADISLGVTSTAISGETVGLTASRGFGFDPVTGAQRPLMVNSLGQLLVTGASTTSTGGSNVFITGTVNTIDTSSYDGLSQVAVALTTAYSQNITIAAGVSGPCEFCLGSVGAGGANVGFFYNWTKSAAVPASWYYYATTTTPVCVSNRYPGTFLHLSVTGVALSVTAGVNYSVRH